MIRNKKSPKGFSQHKNGVINVASNLAEANNFVEASSHDEANMTVVASSFVEASKTVGANKSGEENNQNLKIVVFPLLI